MCLIVINNRITIPTEVYKYFVLDYMSKDKKSCTVRSPYRYVKSVLRMGQEMVSDREEAIASYTEAALGRLRIDELQEVRLGFHVFTGHTGVFDDARKNARSAHERAVIVAFNAKRRHLVAAGTFDGDAYSAVYTRLTPIRVLATVASGSGRVTFISPPK
jgi:hypothetical protein